MKNKLIVILSVLVFGFFLFRTFQQELYLLNPDFTVGKATEVGYTGNAAYLYYRYTVGEKIYTGAEKLGNECGDCKVGKFYKIEYSKARPDFSRLVFKQEITDSLTLRKSIIPVK